MRLVSAAPERLTSLCIELEHALGEAPAAVVTEALVQLARVLATSPPQRPPVVIDLVERLSTAGGSPWAVLREMLPARDPETARRVLGAVRRLADSGGLDVDDQVIEQLAARVEAEPTLAEDASSLETVAAIVGRYGGGIDPLRDLLLGDRGPPVRRLAALVLDLEGAPPDEATVRGLLGVEGQRVLAPYLAFSGARHRDLVDLADPEGGVAPAAAAVARAEAACGEPTLRAVIGELGWPGLALGLEARRLAGVRISGSIPLWMDPREASFVAACSSQASLTGEAVLVIAHGGSLEAGGDGGRNSGPIERFRALNLLHSELLQGFLDVAPLTVEAAWRTLERMDRVVESFTELFAAHAPDCSILPDLYRELRHDIASRLESEPEDGIASPDVTRLVNAFDDPAALGDVCTLHGLKRFLHQRGLQLGSRLAGPRTRPRRSVDLALAVNREVVAVRRIRYVDFDAAAGGSPQRTEIPFPVRRLAEAFACQLVAGQRQFPHADVFCYGNEVHTYLSYRNHPAFLRIDLSPPLRGGMVDLEFFGVSAYEHDHHPAPELAAVTTFLRELGFDVTLDGTRIHARCDKESVLDLETLSRRVDDAFRLAPYLMDLDWTIGSLALELPTRQSLVRCWASAFRDWGVLPLAELLTSDRRGVRVGVELGPTGARELAWSGSGPLRDGFDPSPPYDVSEAVHQALTTLGLELPPPGPDDRHRLPGQRRFAATVLEPLRAAVARGQVTTADGGFAATPPSLFRLEHEAELIAARLALGPEATAPLAATGRVVASLERNLRFRTTGHVAGREVQHARLGLVGTTYEVFVLRDEAGLVRLALYSCDGGLFSRRERETEPWRCNARDDEAALALALRRANYQVAGADAGFDGLVEEAAVLIRDIASVELPREPGPLPGEVLVTGLPASPGRVVGRAVFNADVERPQDLQGAVLVSPSLGPDDTIAIYHAGGVVSTGGGVLSHAGLIAIQFHKPALVVPGEWRTDGDGSRTMVFTAPEFSEVASVVAGLPVVTRRDHRERQCVLREGDLVVVNATLGTFRVLGRNHATLAIHEELQRLGDANRRLEQAADDSEVLVLRGRRVRSVHRLHKLVEGLSDPVVARWLVREMLLGELIPAGAGGRGARAEILSRLALNPVVGDIARHFVERTARELAGRLESGLADARRRIPSAGAVIEVLHPRLKVLRLHEELHDAEACLEGRARAAADRTEVRREVDALAAGSLARLRETLLSRLERLDPADPALRHLLRQLDRLDAILPAPPPRRHEDLGGRLAARDEPRRSSAARRYVVPAVEAGLELQELIGAKAANLAEVGRLAGYDLIPPWFAVTDTAFRETLRQRPSARSLDDAGLATDTPTLARAIDSVLGTPDLGDRERSRRIRGLWSAIQLPTALTAEVVAAYEELGAVGPAGIAASADEATFVALRSSSREEDLEQAARAGEFDTFLFVSGSAALLDHLKQTWGGLWTERAIHNRAALRTVGHEGGGVVVQRIAWARVSGIVLTINVGGDDLNEIVINSGLGLGEGVVSGAVAADLITVSKEPRRDPGRLRFSYVTADKRRRVVFNRRAGAGTVLADTLYHQRLRPSLEYVELCELVAAVTRLESAYGYPLDIEFAWEDDRLWILQARPVATFFADLRDTRERYPIAAAAPCKRSDPEWEVVT